MRIARSTATRGFHSYAPEWRHSPFQVHRVGGLQFALTPRVDFAGRVVGPDDAPLPGEYFYLLASANFHLGNDAQAIAWMNRVGTDEAADSHRRVLLVGSEVASGRHVSYKSYDMSTRINARIDDELSQRLDELRQRSGQTLTEIIEAAIRSWTTEKLGERPSAAKVFASTGFIGSGKGPRDLARNAKQYLTESLVKKA